MNARHPTRHPLLIATLVVSLPLALAGCGNKGPLVMAEEPAENEAVPTPEGSVPVEIATPQTLPADAAADPATDAVTPDPTATDGLDGTAAPTEPAAEPAVVDPRIPIDPATVPTGGTDTDSDSPPATGTADDGNG